MYGYVYEITNNVNGKKYVGKRVGFTDVKTYMGSGTALKQAQKKYGIENFTKRIICEYATRELLNEAEKYFIAVYRHFYGPDMMYNITDGGEGGCGHHSEEAKKKMSVAKKGEKNPMYGKESWFKGKRHTDEAKKKMSDANKGQSLSEEHKAKLSAAQKGEKNHMYGKYHSEETKKKMSDALKEYWRRKKSNI